MSIHSIPITVIEAIAKKCFEVETLEPRNLDSLDFHNVSVWSIKEALREAYEAGKKESNHA